MYAQAIEEAFHDNHAAGLRGSFLNGAMEIKDHPRFVKTRWEQVTWPAILNAAAGVGEPSACAIINREHDTFAQESCTGIVADSKSRGGCGFNTAPLQV